VKAKLKAAKKEAAKKEAAAKKAAAKKAAAKKAAAKKAAAKKAAAKKAASLEKRPGSDRVKGVVPGAISTNEPLVGGVEDTSGIVRMLAILLFSLPVLLMTAALVPLNFVPYNLAHGWERIRVPVALCGVFLLMIEGSMYLLAR
jgi:hypothetical protein